MRRLHLQTVVSLSVSVSSSSSVILGVSSRTSNSTSIRASTLEELYIADGTMQISRKYQLIYVHTPKTGGTTIETSSLFSDKPIPASSHFTIDEMTARDATTGFATATTIRHPCDRFVSSWQYTKHDPRAKGAKSIADRFFLGNYENIEDWVDYLEKYPRQWMRIQRKVIHFTPMVHWTFHQDGNFGIDVVLCQEEWGDGVERLSEIVNIVDNVPQELLNLRHRHTNHSTCASLPTRTVKAIEKAYVLDMCVFGYGIFRSAGLAICSGRQLRSRDFYTERYRICHKELLTR
jgi:hypothetical protein